ncbi:GNAT family N-acetyltransferase [Nordella sp. HKS 07]|uniref:GNAT family N-acetyltransferase n=1 Tax=Nordella sp. HKS 07 TaxID=2712222 RepID=UPI0013E130BC|nr:GNAT family N-acetyltransferase [Nordella sp. HKS 07]QIG46345.1 GNAT family N-acetyltransferase [Nordella sp. HKS 07]
MSGITTEILTGARLEKGLDAVVGLRIEVFRAFPYLYEGSLDYERRYLTKLAAAPGAVIVVARDGKRIVGASTGLPLANEHDEFKAPFLAQGFDIATIFYCAESVLSAEYRGRGLGHAFFDSREAQARKLGHSRSTFCAVVRAEDDPRRPADYRPLDGFWTKRQYHPVKGLVTAYRWTEIGAETESEQTLQFWMRDL